MDLFHMPSAEEVVPALFVLLFCGLIGLEREVHRKDAGIRTHVLVGLGSYLFTLVSLYGAPSALTCPYVVCQAAAGGFVAGCGS